MTDHPTPASPLSADDVGLLKRGDVLSRKGRPVFYRDDGGRMEGWLAFQEMDGATGATRRELLTFIGRPDADGWISWSGGENPVPGVRVDVRWRGGREAAVTADIQDWTWLSETTLDDDDIIAFRLSLPTDRRAEAEADKKHGPKCWGRTSYSDEVAHCYCGDTPPSAGPDAGLEPFEQHPALASWIQKMASGRPCLSLGEWMVFLGALNAALRQSAAAALEAAAERERNAEARIAVHVDDRRMLTTMAADNADRAEAQVADRDKRIAELEAVEKAARVYFFGWMVDEAQDDGPEFTGCTVEQHEAAKALDQALSAIPTPGRSE